MVGGPLTCVPVQAEFSDALVGFEMLCQICTFYTGEGEVDVEEQLQTQFMIWHYLN